MSETIPREALQTDTDPLSPTMAARFSAVQLACAALWASDKMDAPNRAVITAVRDAIEWPASTRLTLDRYLNEPVSVDEIELNPHLSAEQILLLFYVTLVATNCAPVAGAWCRLYGLEKRELEFLWERLSDTDFMRDASHSGKPEASIFLDPPDELLPFAQKQSWRLSLGQAKLSSISHIQAHLYEHPWDREALHKMKSVTGFDTITRKLSEWHFEKINHLTSQGHHIRVGPAQFPELYEIYMLCCERAGMAENPPDFYVAAGGLGAMTSGIDNPQVVLMTAAIGLLSPQELMFVIGHELGHIRSGHVMYSLLAKHFSIFVDFVGKMTLGIGSVLGKGMELAILDWQRKAELTSDRYGLLCCQDFEAATAVLVKMAGAPPAYYDKINWEAFADQGRNFEADTGLHNKIYKWFLSANKSHPWPAVRAHQLRTWVEQGDYTSLVGADPKGWSATNRLLEAAAVERPSSPASQSVQPPSPSVRHPVAPAPEQEPISSGNSSGDCVRCESALQPGDQFCPDCGMRVPEDDDETPLFCIGCGCEDLREGDVFCPVCGNPL